MDERLRRLARHFQATGESEQFFLSHARLGIEPHLVEFLARLGYAPAIDLYYGSGGKKLSKSPLTLKFIKTVNQLFLIRLIGKMLYDSATQIFGFRNASKDWYTPIMEEYLGVDPEEIKQAFWQLTSPLLTENLRFEYPDSQYVIERWNREEIPIPQYAVAINDALTNMDEIATAYRDEGHGYRDEGDLLEEGEITNDQHLLFILLREFEFRGGDGFHMIFNPKRSLIAPHSFNNLYAICIQGAGRWGRKGKRPTSHQLKVNLINDVITLALIDGYAVRGKDRRTRYTRARDTAREAQQQQDIVEKRVYGAWNLPKTEDQMVWHEGQWVSQKSLQAKTAPKAEVTLRNIKNIIDDNPIQTYPFDISQREEESCRGDNSHLRIRRTIIVTLKRNASNKRASASRKAQAAGLVGMLNLKNVVAWTGITLPEHVRPIAELIRELPGVEKVIISEGHCDWVCPACDRRVSALYLNSGEYSEHQIDDENCLNTQDFNRRYRSRGGW
jgi:hypothetical protein